MTEATTTLTRAVIAWALTGGPVWAWIGVVPLATGLFNLVHLPTPGNAARILRKK